MTWLLSQPANEQRSLPDDLARTEGLDMLPFTQHRRKGVKIRATIFLVDDPTAYTVYLRLRTVSNDMKLAGKRS